MKKGLELFNCRAYGEKPNFKLLEDNGIFLPPLYKLFFTYFEVGDFMTNLFDFEKGTDEIYRITPFLTSVSSNNNMPIFDLLDDEDGIINLNKAYKTLSYLVIGAIQSEMLLVGIDTNNEDRIFMYRFNDRVENDPSFVKIGENIFEYIHQLKEVEVDFCKENKHRLYKNWGEDFWRLREGD